ncbi:hypothetical protein IPZ58_07415 [Streptomyces roseoverticillatus]|uniref:hypothetical protein n=1 Tax=Streptomyces roseoverticillatus TaxID=66429 RepID=UPI001F361AE1|nr:hypothetical protein [Streptomyces roseoverticillatus]MCF3101407.1 hypothetical protein [Streptomyces roseoverticillatus]
MYLLVPLDADRYQSVFGHMTPEAAAKDIARGLQVLEEPLHEIELIALDARLWLLLRGLMNEVKSLILRIQRENPRQKWISGYTSMLRAKNLLESEPSDRPGHDLFNVAPRVHETATTAQALWEFLGKSEEDGSGEQ